MKVLSIDPGTEKSAWILYETGQVHAFGIVPNDEILTNMTVWWADHLVVEMVACYGQRVGREVFDTCVWIGRFVDRWITSGGATPDLMYRRNVIRHLCGGQGNDAAVRAALIDRFGPGKDKAIGKKDSQGPLYGVTKDVWQALGIAVTYVDMHAHYRRMGSPDLAETTQAGR